MARAMKITVLWNALFYSVATRYKCFVGNSCFHLHRQRKKQEVSPKHWYLSTKLHSVTSKEMAVFILHRAHNWVSCTLVHHPQFHCCQLPCKYCNLR
jgi:hypothetical protein